MELNKFNSDRELENIFDHDDKKCMVLNLEVLNSNGSFYTYVLYTNKILQTFDSLEIEKASELIFDWMYRKPFFIVSKKYDDEDDWKAARKKALEKVPKVIISVMKDSYDVDIDTGDIKILERQNKLNHLLIEFIVSPDDCIYYFKNMKKSAKFEQQILKKLPKYGDIDDVSDEGTLRSMTINKYVKPLKLSGKLLDPDNIHGKNIHHYFATVIDHAFKLKKELKFLGVPEDNNDDEVKSGKYYKDNEDDDQEEVVKVRRSFSLKINSRLRTKGKEKLKTSKKNNVSKQTIKNAKFILGLQEPDKHEKKELGNIIEILNIWTGSNKKKYDLNDFGKLISDSLYKDIVNEIAMSFKLVQYDNSKCAKKSQQYNGKILKKRKKLKENVKVKNTLKYTHPLKRIFKEYGMKMITQKTTKNKKTYFKRYLDIDDNVYKIIEDEQE